ncbi:NAD(P)H-hydrate dehydratase [Geofilum sp. OHC36d9]|uniref:NAD(P)H-hydrate dehydratase n=1 Tax=Geofilum sp. OHC36d9 TaxID=3458413 RepID=UPI0040339BDA
MKIFPVQTISKIDAYTIEHEPILSVNLMERAARKIFDVLRDRYNGSAFLVLAGPGNNGGDALAVARMLLLNGFDVTIAMLKSEGLSSDAQLNRSRLNHLQQAKIVELDKGDELLQPEVNTIILDGLFGSGLNRPLEKEALALVKRINGWSNTVIAIDIPSGLMGEDNFNNHSEGIIKADLTLTLQFPKLSFFFPDTNRYVGRYEVLPIGLHPVMIEQTKTEWFYTCPEKVKQMFPTRERFTHKGEMGHVLLIAGSIGKMGAAVLASRACLKSGIGLLTTHVPHDGCNILQIAVPEAMVSIDRSDLMFTEFPDLSVYSAVGIGPGIGKGANSAKAFIELLGSIGTRPLVIDADGLNILAAHPEWLEKLPEGAVLTPHPGEFRRLVGEWSSDFDRLQKAIAFGRKYHVVLVLKGAFTTVVWPDGTAHFNPTGNPGMATAGSGDALTGVILALLGRGIDARYAAIIGAYIHGRAGDMAAGDEGFDGLTTTDLIKHLGIAFKELQ